METRVARKNEEKKAQLEKMSNGRGIREFEIKLHRLSVSSECILMLD